MDAERAYDFQGTHLPIYLGFAGVVSDRLLEARARVTPFGAGLALRTPLVAGFPLDGGEHLLDLEIGVTQGRVACLAIRSAHGEPLTGALLRSVPVAEIVTTGAAANSFRVFRTKGGRYIGVYYSDSFDSMPGFRDDLDELRADVGRQRRSIDLEFLTKVADLYRRAVAEGQPPATVIEKELGPTTRENARRWIMRAREAGLLGKPLGPGLAGEQPARGGTR